MNEHIKLLVEQSVKSIDIVTGNELLDYELYKMYIPDCFAKKFAELIVRECVTVMYDSAIKRKVPPDLNQTPTYYAVAVLEHFGVEL
jgi:hypothetical protein